MTSSVTNRGSGNAAWIVIVFTGVVAALHIWKLPAAIPLIQQQLGLSLVEAGILLGLVQVAGMLGGLAISLLAEVIGPRRCLMLGLGLLFGGSVLGGFSHDAGLLMSSRVLEGAGFLLVTVVAPGLIRLHTTPWRLNTAMGFWTAYMGFATFVGLISTAFILQIASWQAWWFVMAAVTLIPVPLILRHVPVDAPAAPGGAATALKRIGITARSPKPWVAGITFSCYTVQWVSVVGFLPGIYEAQGITGVWPGILSAVVGGLNAVGNICTSPLIQRGIPPRILLISGFLLMAASSTLAFAVPWETISGGVIYQVLCVAVFSFTGGAIPATLTRMAVDLAPEGGSAPAAMGLMQQLFNLGSFVGPAIAAWIATTTGGWQSTWWMTCFFAMVGISLSLWLSEKRLGLQFSQQAPAPVR